MHEMKKYWTGEALYGDDFGPQQIQEWYRDEQEAYYDLTFSTYGHYEYAYHAMNWHYAYSKLPGDFFATCLAFGCATGDDVAPLAPRVAEFVCVEPDERFWRSALGGKRARFLKPSPSGELPVGTGCVDLIVCLGVLHHIPNVSFVVGEFARVLAPHGWLVLREPVSSMGDWRKPRRGLTKRERGIPLKYLRERLRGAGLAVVSQALCGFPLVPRLAKLMRVRHAYNSRALVWLDWLMSRLMRWNISYHRDSLLKKLAPSEVFVVATKRAGT